MSYEKYIPVEIGFVSILPPIEVVSSLLLGSVVASIIYSIAVLNGMVEGLSKANPVDVLFTVMGTKIANNVHICLFLLLMGGLINLISTSGGSKAYGKMAQRVVKGKRPALFSTLFLGVVMFLDDYFNAITTGTVMRNVADVNKVSKPKLAYIVHTVATNMCITIPLTSWAAAIVSQIKDSGVDNSFMVFLNTIPYNIYSFLSFIMIILTSAFDFDYGKMKYYEDNAKLGLSATDGSIDKAATIEHSDKDDKGSVWDLLAPILILIILSIYFMFYLGGLFDSDISITDALGATSAPKALLYACCFALLSSLLLYVPRKLMTFLDWMENFKEGMKTMIPTLTILVLAWTISGTSGDLLKTGDYVGHLVAKSPIPAQMLPAVIFLVGMALSFSMGTAWGTFGVLIPIVVKICSGDNRKYLEVSLASCLCGSVFGDNTSPISDTTILASSSTQCSFLVHVATQLPYAITTAVVSIIGYLIAGWTQSVFVTLLVSILLLLAVLATIRMTRKKHAEPVVEVELPEVKKDGDEEKTEKTEENEVDEVVIGEAPPVEVSMDVQP
ncbi:sodium/proton antiporter [Blastocystis sp. ATCC 50177/Nand II]|uniref:Sodium/proton antiporter n=1 Tax=Blastocystis sp. subtype 1 (strain ATCC 50177 / NandII) TaxID=478820 RepID=A0A196SLL9_BLAHN|nr:sodium/proton antiporter [Blastocystis sp. ATCC 50177/Nand II]